MYSRIDFFEWMFFLFFDIGENISPLAPLPTIDKPPPMEHTTYKDEDEPVGELKIRGGLSGLCDEDLSDSFDGEYRLCTCRDI